MLVENSKDILYLVISFCVLWVTVFLCWVFYYIMRLLRNTNQVVEEFRMRLQTLTETIHYIRGKVEHISDFMALAGNGVGGMVKNIITRKAKQWVDKGSNKMNDVAKDAVDKAVKEASKGMKKMARKIKK